jgi:hypothetical protein
VETFPPEDDPPVLIPFLMFRLMVGMSLIMLGVSWFGTWLRFRGRLEATRWYLWAAFVSFPGFVAVTDGLVHRRDRPPALGGLRPVAHPGCGDAVAGDRLAAGLYRGLRDDLFIRPVLHLSGVAGRAGGRGECRL